METIAKVMYNHHYKTNTRSHFLDGAIPIETKSNSGVYGNGSNDCFWISITDGLANYGIKITPPILKKSVNFNYENTMVDTNYDDHKNAIAMLVNIYDLELHIHQGIYHNRIWYVQPVPVSSFISSTKEYVIRVIQKPNHFELITTQNGFFGLDDIENDESKLIEEQREIEKRMREQKEDLEMAIRLQLEENPNAVIKINYI
jgi:hypothetical protein